MTTLEKKKPALKTYQVCIGGLWFDTVASSPTKAKGNGAFRYALAKRKDVRLIQYQVYSGALSSTVKEAV